MIIDAVAGDRLSPILSEAFPLEVAFMTADCLPTHVGGRNIALRPAPDVRDLGLGSHFMA